MLDFKLKTFFYIDFKYLLEAERRAFTLRIDGYFGDKCTIFEGRS